MADRRHDWHAAGRDRAHEPLVAERQQVLEAAASTGQDDDVDVRVLAESADRRDDLPGGARALHVRLGHEDGRRREAGADRRHDIALRGRVVAGHHPDAARQERQRPLARIGEETLGGERRLETFERGEMGTDAEPLDRERAELELTALFVELRPSEHMHPLAVREAEP